METVTLRSKGLAGSTPDTVIMSDPTYTCSKCGERWEHCKCSKNYCKPKDCPDFLSGPVGSVYMCPKCGIMTGDRIHPSAQGVSRGTTTDAVEILRKRYGKPSWWERFKLWLHVEILALWRN